MRRARVATVVVAVLCCVVTAMIIGPRSPSGSPPAQARPTPQSLSASPIPSQYAIQMIPASYLRLYIRAAGQYGLDWTKLAAVGQIESDHGQSLVHGVATGTNSSGAAGPAQFLPSTWARYGVDADGRGAISPYDPADAITAMAAYLKASGAPEHWDRSLFTYNHSVAYVDAVLALSRRFGGS